MSQKKTLAELMISPNREALLLGGLEDIDRRIEQTTERVAIVQAILQTLEAERTEVQGRLEELHRLRKEAQA